MTDFDRAQAKELIKVIQEALLELNALLSQEPATTQQPTSSHPTPQTEIPKGLQAAKKDQFTQPPQTKTQLTTNSNPSGPQPIQQEQPKQQSFLPPDIEKYVTVQEDNWNIYLEPKHYLPTELFKKISEFVKQHGGVYVTKAASENGKPYWKIPT